MPMHLGYRILAKGLSFSLGLAACAGFAFAQQPVGAGPTTADMYCSSVMDNKPVPTDTYVISGENSRYKTTFSGGDFIYINHGGEAGMKAGDEFDVVRPISDPTQTVWFKYQPMLTKAMGTTYLDIGRLRVLHVDAKTSTGQMSLMCAPAQRGDILRRFVARPTPPFHNIALDPFAPPSGKKTAMVVTTRDYGVLAGPGRIAYVNLGSAQGVRIGDYFRVFRYQGTRNDTNYEVKDLSYKALGFGSSPVAYEWNNLPRQILGEGIVLRLGTNSATILMTTVRFEIYAGDYVELE